MSAARKYTRAGTRRGPGTPVGAGGTAVGTDFGAGIPVDAGGTIIGVEFGADGAGGTADGVGRGRRTYGWRPVCAGGTADGRGATVVGDFGATFFRCAKHLSLRAAQAGSTPRLMHSPRA
jgi:hypothetical protein